jgi:hypothetical protein
MSELIAKLALEDPTKLEAMTNAVIKVAEAQARAHQAASTNANPLETLLRLGALGQQFAADKPGDRDKGGQQ